MQENRVQYDQLATDYHELLQSAQTNRVSDK